MPDISPADIWFDPRKILPAAKNALMYPVTHPAETAQFGLSIAPGSGEAMAGVDAWNASGRASNALLSGNYGQAASEYGNMGAALLGAIPGAGIIARGTARGAAWMDRNLPKGVNRLLDAAMPSDPQNTAFAIPAWHGSPHDFDEFKLDKIGTGEGAQAYGHGLYFAEHPEVAKAYRDNISAWNNPNSQGKTVDVDALTKELSDMGAGKYSNMLANGAKQAYNDVAYAKGGNPASFDEVIKNVADVYGHDSPIIQRLEGLKKEATNAGNFQGRLYRAELDVEPHDLLDWDKPLSAQPEGIKNAIAKFAEERGRQPSEIQNWLTSDSNFYSGSQLYDVLKQAGESPEAYSAALHRAGIPGVKYQDQFSRGTEGGTSNFVIFDDKLVKVLKKE